MEIKIILPPFFNECPSCWQNFIIMLQNNYGDRFWNRDYMSLIRKELKTYNATFDVVNDELLSPNVIVFDNPLYYTLFMLRFA